MIEVKYNSEVPYLTSCDQCNMGPHRGIGWYTITSYAPWCTWCFCSEACANMWILRGSESGNDNLRRFSFSANGYPKV